jgi:hypothetical protein
VQGEEEALDPRDELRAALQAERTKQGRETDEFEERKAALAQARLRYEEEERAVFAYLHDLADEAVAALARSADRESVPITPKPYGLGRLVRSQQFVEGWRVQLGEHEERVLCPDGTLVTPTTSEAREPGYSRLRVWIDDHRQGLYNGPFSESPRATTPWGRAFSVTTAHGDRTGAQGAISAQLQQLKESIANKLVSILQKHGVSPSDI